MSPSKAPPFFFAVPLLWLAPACGLSPALQNGGAAVRADGITLEVPRQSCSETVQAKQPGNDLVEVIVEVAIRNPTAAPLSVNRSGFRLSAPDGSAIPPSTWFVKDPLTVGAGQSQTFQLRFMSRGGLSCWKPMELRATSVLTQGPVPVGIGSVRFTASHALPGYGTPAAP
jgi:hypothetical protein